MADALEQLGYQAENGTWRNFYLSGAKELRGGVHRVPIANPQGADTLAAMPLEVLFDFLAIRLDGPRAADVDLRILFRLTDDGRSYLLRARNGVLNSHVDPKDNTADATLSLTHAQLLGLLVTAGAASDGVPEGVQVDGRAGALSELFGLLDHFDPWFNIIEP